jgi:LysM repeat protein
VKGDETFYSIAQKFGVKQKRLIDANPSIDYKHLKKGDILNIPK